ncbi:endogenous retrovirus group S71 member 1 Env polyprotein-like [Saccopteryx leptura]|uniref:endogenous retrovirus group S71 member 1 Env polyprotein-like n=1 Tax=Saccopteryx leptura TaxID=249018 RepID=UPI00339BEA8E
MGLQLPGIKLGLLQLSSSFKPPKADSPKVELNPNFTASHSPETVSPTKATPIANTLAHPSPSLEQSSSIFTFLDSVFPVLNSSQSEATKSCWLCLDLQPPYYVGLGANVSFQNVTVNDSDYFVECKQEGRISLAGFQEEGHCFTLGELTDPTTIEYQNSCLSMTHISPPAAGRPWILKAPEGTWVSCLSRVNNCILPSTSDDFCISTYIVPQVYLYGGNSEFLLQPDIRYRAKRAVPLLLPIIATLGITGAIAIEASAHITLKTRIKQLSSTFSKNISILQTQMSYLEHAVDFLAEVALQNRRGLNLLFLKQGGLCAAPGEACCFYANHSGIIRESIQVLRKRLQDKEKELQQDNNWYQNIFNWSPWLTTLLTALAGPVLILLLILTCGPVIVNRLVAFVRERIDTVRLMVLAQPYQIIPSSDEQYQSSMV